MSRHLDIHAIFLVTTHLCIHSQKWLTCFMSHGNAVLAKRGSRDLRKLLWMPQPPLPTFYNVRFATISTRLRLFQYRRNDNIHHHQLALPGYL